MSKQFVAACLVTGLFASHMPAAEAQSGRRALSMVPRNSSLVIGMNVSALKGSTVFRRVIARMSAQTALKPALEVLRRGAGIDIHTQVNTLVLALAPDFERSKQIALFLDARTDRKRLLTYAKRRDPTFKRLRRRGVPYYRIANEIEVAFLGRFTVLAGRGHMATIIDTRGRTAPAVDNSPGFRAMITPAQLRRPMWAVFDLPTVVTNALSKHLGKHGIRGVMVSAAFTNGLQLQLRIAAGSNSEAKKLGQRVRSWLFSTAGANRPRGFGFPSLRGFVVRVDKRNIDVAGKLSSKQLTSFRSALLTVL